MSAGSGYVDALAFLPGGERLISAGYDGSLRFWSLSRHELVFELFPHEAAILRFAVSPDASRIATASMDGTARVIDNRMPSERDATVRRVRGDREAARALVARRLRELGTRAAVAASLRGDGGLDDFLRQEALKELLRGTRHLAGRQRCDTGRAHRDRQAQVERSWPSCSSFLPPVFNLDREKQS